MKFPKTNPMKDKRKRTRKKAVKVKDPEGIIQGLAEQLLNCYAPRITFFRISDLLYRTIFNNPHIPVHIKRHLKDDIGGIQDLIMFNIEDKFYEALEIKTETGELNTQQKEWQRKLNGKVSHAWEDTKEKILAFVNREK